MQIRFYTIKDRSPCLEIFRSNVPAYFAASDEQEFAHFLDKLPGPFCIVEIDGEVVACGGLAADHPELNVATLCWGMVAANLHRHGIGRALLDFRMRILATEYPSTRRVRVNTTQVAQAFFQRHDFIVIGVETDGYGAGLNRVVMDCAVR
jgi:N-acetylglutamate synthase-like GNAT family acetyltransferase